MTKYKDYYNGIKKPVGGLCLCNFGGLVVFEIIYGIDDYCISGFDFGDGVKDIRTTKIHYTTSGRNYIIRGKNRCYFDEIMRF